jgi:hypothetical protein
MIPENESGGTISLCRAELALSTCRQTDYEMSDMGCVFTGRWFSIFDIVRHMDPKSIFRVSHMICLYCRGLICPCA